MHVILLLIVIFFASSPIHAESGKEIIIRLDFQKGGAYKDGILVREFEIMSGDGPGGQKPTPRGNFSVIRKSEKHYSQTYDAPMPFSLFFKPLYAIHSRGGELPVREVRRNYASHGCISVDHEVASWLFGWAPIGAPVTIIGDRTGD